MRRRERERRRERRRDGGSRREIERERERDRVTEEVSQREIEREGGEGTYFVWAAWAWAEARGDGELTSYMLISSAMHHKDCRVQLF